MPNSYKQEDPMNVYPHRMGARHARHARRIGEGNESAGVRWAIEVTYKLLYEEATAEELREWVCSRRLV